MCDKKFTLSDLSIDSLVFLTLSLTSYQFSPPFLLADFSFESKVGMNSIHFLPDREEERDIET
jgi:hypothetical protein